jgi:predicted HicB family RNase H-like nuclease
MTYKGYMGSVEISEEDNCLYGKVLNLPDNTLISYEGETVADLREDFHASVDGYLEHCVAEGIEPYKSYSGALNVRLTPDMHSQVAALSKKAGVSINAFIKAAVQKEIASML